MATRPGPAKPQLSLTLTPEKAEYRAGSLPNFKVTIKNTGGTAVKLCTYMLKYRLLAAMNMKDQSGQDFALFPFVTARYAPIKPADLKLIPPGQEISETINTAGTTEWGWVKNGSLPPMVTRGFIQKGFPAGTHTFTTGIYGGMAIYQGLADAYDSTWVKKTLPEEIQGADKLDATGVFRGELLGKIAVKFA